MSTGFYAAASGMLMQERVLNVMGNNMANTKTPGYKAEQVVSNIFEQTLLNRIEGGNNFIGVGAPVRIVQDVPTGFDDPSALEQTDRPYDMAINGIGFFNIKSTDAATGEEQIYLTRNGNFDVDAEGYLILRGAGRVQGHDGDIQLESANFRVNYDGTVYDEKGAEIDKLYINAANPNTLLTKASNGLYKVDTDPKATPLSADGTVTYDTGETAGLTELTDVDIRQGWLETSNVDLNREMSMVMETTRNFQSCSKVLQIIDERNQKTNTICSR